MIDRPDLNSKFELPQIIRIRICETGGVRGDGSPSSALSYCLSLFLDCAIRIQDNLTLDCSVRGPFILVRISIDSLDLNSIFQLTQRIRIWLDVGWKGLRWVTINGPSSRNFFAGSKKHFAFSIYLLETLHGPKYRFLEPTQFFFKLNQDRRYKITPILKFFFFFLLKLVRHLSMINSLHQIKNSWSLKWYLIYLTWNTISCSMAGNLQLSHNII